MRTKRLAWNTISSLILQITTVVCGFVLPRLILNCYGSEVNGLISSITQFLSLISFLDCGVGIVVQSALYKPLADNDISQINLIVSSANNFFTKLAYILVVYVFVLVVVLPYLIDTSFSKEYITSLILILSVNSFVQYYLSVVDSVILAANQKAYISNILQCMTLILNTLLSVILILNQYSIHFVRFSTMLVYLLKPIITHMYVQKKYAINRKAKYTEEPITQKWNGTAQHVAAIVLDNTDIVILTFFSTINTVSVYSVYNLVVTGIRQIILTVGNGFHSYWGSLFAEKRYEKIATSFDYIEWFFHTIVVLFFGVTGILIIPFIGIYTSGIKDVNYYQPLFAVLMVLAQAIRCIRQPYNTLIQAIGHYKQTQICYVIAAIINIVVSIIAVRPWGLVGVALGTVVAMLYQLVWMMCYDSKIILFRDIKVAVKQIVVDVILVIICVWICILFDFNAVTDYKEWIFLAVQIVCIWGTVSIIVNFIFYRKYLMVLIHKIKGRK